MFPTAAFIIVYESVPQAVSEIEFSDNRVANRRLAGGYIIHTLYANTSFIFIFSFRSIRWVEYITFRLYLHVYILRILYSFTM